VQDAYLVEHYRPGQSVDDLHRSLARVREAVTEMAREGKEIRYLSSTLVPDDESYLSVLHAESEELVREAYARAATPFERISRAIADQEQLRNNLQQKGADQ
jgi:Protein of unknown function (DUF4242)